MTEEERLEKKIKVAICSKGCGRHILVAALPDAERDSEIRKDFLKASRQGCEIDYIKIRDMQFGCECKQPRDSGLNGMFELRRSE